MRVGVILSGCGFRDGAEIHESVLTLLALSRAGAEAVCFAPDIPQAQVVDHRTGRVVETSRNVLTESARIARGAITDVAAADPSSLDALILPGGFGAALNLCDFAAKGAGASVHPAVARLVHAVHDAGKPIGALCIAPALVARVLGAEGPQLTIGDDADTAAAIEACGAEHVPCPVDGIVVDEDLRLVSTPAYMLGPTLADVATGVEKAVAAVLRLASAPAIA